MSPSKNILLMIADDLGREQVGCYGGESRITPNLDGLAASGSRFDMAFTRTASCSGSRTVIYTGLHTHETGSYGLTHGNNGFRTFDNVESAPLLFKNIGYKTGILGKIADEADAFFQLSKAEDNPFFFTIGFVDPHRQLGTQGGFGNVQDNYDPRLNDKIFKPEDVTVPSFLSDIPEVREEFAEYYRSIHQMDQGVGMVLRALERNGLADDTLVLFLSDNGPPFVNSKTTLFEAGVRLPFLMRAPGFIIPGNANPNLVSYVDILPTFLDWAGHSNMPSQAGFVQRKGRSILSIAGCSRSQPGWDRVFGSHTFHEITNYWPTRFMRNRRFKYRRNICWKLDFLFAMDLYASRSWEGMRNASGDKEPMIGPRRLRDYICRPPEELFDLENDPREVANLAGNPEYAEILKSMRDALESWQKSTGDLWLWRDGAPVVRYLSSNYAREARALKRPVDSDTSVAYATYINFAEQDILENDDGLPTHPLLPHYGKATYPITTDGNGRQQVEAHLSYWEGTYWIYAATWACGGSLLSYGRPAIDVANVTKPLVRYSNSTGNYVLFMGGNDQSNFYYATSKAPGGPWSEPPSLMTGEHLTHDFDVAVGPDGAHYILTDTWSNVTENQATGHSVPVWDIYVQKLAPNLTSTVGSNSTLALIRSAKDLHKQGLNLEACGFFYHDSYWYQTYSYTCQNCPGYIYYLYAKDPLGPYTDGGYISLDGCGGQNKGANVLPSAKGPIVLAGNLAYRTSPTNHVLNRQIWHADNHQAASSTSFFPIEFNEDHTIKNFTCPVIVKIPLVKNITSSPEPPVPYQLDCRIRNWQMIVQTFSKPKEVSTLDFPVWQRTDNLVPTTNSGPMLDGVLNVTVIF
ncbi:N-sulfoglucosamine sulfohydrolase [Fusarium oxysporum f. sp. cubense race 1]|uniref:N-sulfoglucosamine sulfohydrolase n=1 Tax=Fusarium oxysporum f. sp. cubense (strain race 1) TaxID=1229664 RepID=N4U8K3_FUSC1|nr:N-sulfoglucosamine sulfohydrolase [Fusarium oxysporum f. sp. cubense race 1]